MWFRVFGRLLLSFGVAWAKVTAILVVLHVLPGRIQDILAGGPDYPGLREATAAEWGLDHSLLRRYLDFLFRIFCGDFRLSGASTVDAVGLQLLPTVELAFTAGLLAILFSVAIALLTVGRGLQSRHFAPVLEPVFASTPVFWLGILLLVAFALDLNWFAPLHAQAGWSLALPSVALALPTTGLIMRVLHEAMDKAPEALPALATPRGGLGDFVRRARHGLRHGLLPIVTFGGWLVGGLLGGALLTEMMSGPVALGPVLAHDIPAVLTIVLLAYFVHIVASILLESVDLIGDPRLRA
jgi:peptide/nickel transport system permease protein